MKNNKITKLNIDLFDGILKSDYKKQRNKFIANYTEYNRGGFFSSGHYEYKPDVAKSKWNNMYPNGFTDWAKDKKSLNAYGEQMVIDKLNKVIEVVNKLVKNSSQ